MTEWKFRPFHGCAWVTFALAISLLAGCQQGRTSPTPYNYVRCFPFARVVAAEGTPRITREEAEARERAAFAPDEPGKLGELLSARYITILELHVRSGAEDPWSNRNVWYLTFAWIPPEDDLQSPRPGYVYRAYAFVDDARGGQVLIHAGDCFGSVPAADADADRIPRATPSPAPAPR